MFTIRVRGSSGQKNFQIPSMDPISNIFTLISEQYDISASKVPIRLYQDFSFKTPLLNQTHTKQTPISTVLKHGQLIFLKTPPKEETPQIPFNEQIKQQTFEQLQETIRRPPPSFQTKSCTHPSTIYCMQCLAAWETHILEIAGISKLNFENQKLQKNASTTNTKRINDVRLETQHQLVIKYQGSGKLKSVKISSSVGESLTKFAQQFNFDVEMSAQLFGLQDQVYAITFPFFRSVKGKIEPQIGPLYSSITEITAKIALFNFGISPIGRCFLTQKRQFSAQNLVKSLFCEDQILLHAQLIDLSQTNQTRENEFLENKFQQLNGSGKQVLTLRQRKCDGVKIEAFELSQQIQFLWEKNVVPSQQDGGFEMQFSKKQIINDAFLDKIDTDAFIVSVGVQNVVDFINQEENVKNVGQMVENLMDFVYMQQFCQVDGFMNLKEVQESMCGKNEIRKMILDLLKQTQLKIVNDISFLTCLIITGILTEDEVIGKKSQDILKLLENKL